MIQTVLGHCTKQIARKYSVDLQVEFKNCKKTAFDAYVDKNGLRDPRILYGQKTLSLIFNYGFQEYPRARAIWPDYYGKGYTGWTGLWAAMLHEMAHAINMTDNFQKFRDGEIKPHGWEWKRIVIELQKEFPLDAFLQAVEYLTVKELQ